MITETKKLDKLFTRTIFFNEFQTGSSFCVAKLKSAHVCALTILHAIQSSTVKFHTRDNPLFRLFFFDNDWNFQGGKWNLLKLIFNLPNYFHKFWYLNELLRLRLKIGVSLMFCSINIAHLRGCADIGTALGTLTILRLRERCHFYIYQEAVIKYL